LSKNGKAWERGFTPACSGQGLRPKTSRESTSAFFGGHSEECGGALVNLLAFTLRALDLAFLVLVEGEADFKRLFAFFAIIFVPRHEDLRRTPEGGGSK
jgi:hypothetical protein